MKQFIINGFQLDEIATLIEKGYDIVSYDETEDDNKNPTMTVLLGIPETEDYQIYDFKIIQ